MGCAANWSRKTRVQVSDARLISRLDFDFGPWAWARLSGSIPGGASGCGPLRGSCCTRASAWRRSAMNNSYQAFQWCPTTLSPLHLTHNRLQV